MGDGGISKKSHGERDRDRDRERERDSDRDRDRERTAKEKPTDGQLLGRVDGRQDRPTKDTAKSSGGGGGGGGGVHSGAIVKPKTSYNL